MPNIKDLSQKNKKFIYTIAKNILIIYILALIVDYFNLFPLKNFLNFDILFFFVLLLNITTVIVYFLPKNYEKRTKENFRRVKKRKILNYVFIILILFIISTQIPITNPSYQKYLDFYKSISNKILILTITIGSISFLLNKKNIEENIIQEKKEEIGVFKKLSDKSSTTSFFKKVGWHNLILIFLLLVGSFLRLYNLGKLGFVGDEVYQGISMKGFFEVGKPILPNGNYYTSGALVPWLGSLFLHIFKNPEFSLRLVNSLASILMIFIFFKFGKLVLNKTLGILSATIWTFFPWSIEFARWGRPYGFIAFLYLLFFYNLFLHNEHKKKKNLIFASLIIMISFAVHDFSSFMVAILAIYVFVKLLIKSKSLKKKILALLSPVFVFILFSISLYLREYLTSGRIPPLTYPLHIANLLMVKYRNYSSYFINIYKDNLTMVFISLFLFLVFAILTIKTDFVKKLFLFIGSFGGLLLVANFHPLTHITSRYLFPILPLTLFVFCYAFILVLKIFTASSKKTIIAFIIITIIPFQFTDSFKITFRNYGDKFPNILYSATVSIDQYNDVKTQMVYFKENMKDGDIAVTDKYEFFLYYVGREPDYWYGSENRPSFAYEYNNKTKLIRDLPHLQEFIESSKSDIWFVMSLTELHPVNARDLVNDFEILKNKYDLKKVYTGGEEGAIVYKLTN